MSAFYTPPNQTFRRWCMQSISCTAPSILSTKISLVFLAELHVSVVIAPPYPILDISIWLSDGIICILSGNISSTPSRNLLSLFFNKFNFSRIPSVCFSDVSSYQNIQDDTTTGSSWLSSFINPMIRFWKDI